MGTNYYLMTGRTSKQTCNLGCEHEIPEQLHVGKSSYGRYFTMHRETTYDGQVLDSLQKWKNFYESLLKAKFVNEYGEETTPEDMWHIITRDNWEPAPCADREWSPEKIGQKVDPEESFMGCYDVWGERGFIHSNERVIGKDGLYVVVDGEFC